MAKKSRVFREVAADPLPVTVGQFITEILPYTIRDESVQREGVWEDVQKWEYISYAAVGAAKFTTICLVDLVATKKKAEDQRDLAFVKHIVKLQKPRLVSVDGQMKTLIPKWAHLDGGNRCDVFIYFPDGKIKLLAGDYQFQPETILYDDGTEETEPNGYCEEVKEDCTFKELKEKHPIIFEKLMNQKLVVFGFSDLTQDERAELFDILNNGIPTNDQEKRNPSPADICTSIRDDMNKEFKELFIKVGAITVAQAKRFGFCLYLAKLSYAFCDKSKVPSLGSKDDLNTAYKQGSSQDLNQPKFKEFFTNQFVPYIKLMEANEWVFQARTIFIDFFLTLKYMQNNLYKIPKVNKQGRIDFWECFKLWQTELFADDEDTFVLKRGDDGKAKQKATWEGLFTKTNNLVLTYRIEALFDGYTSAKGITHKSFIEFALDKGVIVKLDKKRVATKADKSWLFLDNPKTSTGKNIPVGQYDNTKKFQGDHSKKPHAHGATSNKEDMKLEETEYNRTKGAKTPEQMQTI